MQALLLPFYTHMELESYSRSDRQEILQHVVEYLLGCRRFNVTKRALSEFECHNEFQQTLRDLTPEYQRIYRSALRKYAQGKKVAIHDFDKHHLREVDLTSLNVKRRAYPTEAEVMKSMSYTINSKAYRLRANRKIQRMTSCGVDDIKQIMYLRILGAYRVYLPSVGRCLPTQAFYSILHSALSSSIIDKMRELDSNKAQLTVPFALLGKDFEDGVDSSYYGTGKYHASPEEVLQAKESLYSVVSHQDRLDLMEALSYQG